MAQTLPSSAIEERLRWIKPYLEGKKSLKEVSGISLFSDGTVKCRSLAGVRISDEQIEELLDIDGVTESLVYTTVIGK